jgi:hypothetical protein
MYHDEASKIFTPLLQKKIAMVSNEAVCGWRHIYIGFWVSV